MLSTRALLANTGAVDIWDDRSRTALASPPAPPSSASQRRDRRARHQRNVHFDYSTGDNNVSKYNFSDDMDELVNKLIYYLGRNIERARLERQHHATETSPEKSSRILALESASARVLDALPSTARSTTTPTTTPTASSTTCLEARSSRASRASESCTSHRRTGCEFQPFVDYNVGDTDDQQRRQLRAGALGAHLSGSDGFDVSVAHRGVGTVSQIQTLQGRA